MTIPFAARLALIGGKSRVSLHLKRNVVVFFVGVLEAPEPEPESLASSLGDEGNVEVRHGTERRR
jgi:hypothetical protein